MTAEGSISSDTLAALEQMANKIRYDIVKMIGVGKAGHLGGSCSIAEIVAVLYFHKMRHDPADPKWTERDRFILSKGHSALAQYAALAEAGYFSKDELNTLKQLGSMLQGHPDLKKTPGVEANTGSLGQGLSIACGMAAGLKLDGLSSRVYCIIGDGEIAEGQIWEAAMAAAFYKLDNLTAFLDVNGIQATGPVALRFDTNPLDVKWKAFGWHVIEIDGHDVGQIINAVDSAERIKGKPTIILARTTKGKGIPFAENNAAFHNGIMTEEQYQYACSLMADKAGVSK
jgi:transketolase